MGFEYLLCIVVIISYFTVSSSLCCQMAAMLPPLFSNHLNRKESATNGKYKFHQVSDDGARVEWSFLKFDGCLLLRVEKEGAWAVAPVGQSVDLI